MKRSPAFCLLAILAFSSAAANTRGTDTQLVKTTVFGKLKDGREVRQFTLTNNRGVTMQAIEYGATIVSLSVPDRKGKIEDVVLGYDSLQGYVDDTSYFGAIVGRYGNRIRRGQFQLDGQRYSLTINDGENHLHGGRIGFNKVLWNGTVLDDPAGPSVQFRYVSKDGEEGYPGTVQIAVTYTLTDQNELRIKYEGTTDKPTILNPTQHSYFNLTGDFTRTILDHTLMIEADAFTPVSKGLIPTGELQKVAGTPLDFRTAVRIGLRIDDADEQLRLGQGYDHNWVLRGNPGQVRKVAELYDPLSGRLMSVLTDQPGLQFYSGNFLNGAAKGKKGIAYQRRSGLCLETQAYPDTPNNPQFPQVTLRPGQVYRQTTIYHFSTR
ncbi:MAG: galactose mutarotase [Acidobacteria bacterium]|nr:galactose mutarotase [Acidobacteriota bacterium]